MFYICVQINASESESESDYTEKNILTLTASKSDHISQSYYVFKSLVSGAIKWRLHKIIAGLGLVKV